MLLDRGSVTLVSHTPSKVECFRTRCQDSPTAATWPRKAVAEATLWGSVRILTLAETIRLAIPIGVKTTHQKTSNQRAARNIDIVLYIKKMTSEVFLPEMMYYKHP